MSKLATEQHTLPARRSGAETACMRTFGIGALKSASTCGRSSSARCSGQPETQKPRMCRRKRGERFVHLRFDLQKAARGLHIDLPGRRERDGRCAALKDGRAELLLNLANLVGERRLGNKERFRGCGKAALAHDGEYELSMACIHDAPLKTRHFAHFRSVNREWTLKRFLKPLIICREKRARRRGGES